MKHYTLEQWVDFVNGQGPRENAAAMQEHLDRGCKNCVHTLMAWRRLQQFAKTEPSFEAPAHAVRWAKAACALQAQPQPRKRICDVALLVFDSFAGMLPEGVRGLSPTGRHLLYRAGNVMIDLRMESQAGSHRVSLDGQVMDEGQDKEGLKKVPVSLLSGREPLAQTETNGFGEFHLECEPDRLLLVAVGVSDQKDVFIPLDEAIWRMPFAQ